MAKRMKNMTESRWVACTDPRRMFAFAERWGSQQKMLLFSAGCLRRARHLFSDNRSQRAPELLELMAAGGQIEPEPPNDYLASSEAYWVAQREIRFQADKNALTITYQAYWGNVGMAAHNSAGFMAPSPSVADCAFIRDFFGPLLFRQLAIAADVLAWKERTVPKLAQAAYEGTALTEDTIAPDALAVLADALEEAGCSEQSILDHLHGPGPHFRGCWPVDLVLAKK